MAVMQPAELANDFASLHIPDLDATIVAATDESTAERVVRQRANKHVVSREGPQAFPSGGAPDLDLAIVRARYDQVALQERSVGNHVERTKATYLELDASESAVVGVERPQTLSSRHVPENHLAIAAGACQSITLYTDSIDRTVVTAERTV